MLRLSPEEVIRLLREVPYFTGLQQTDLAPLAAACRLRQYRTNQVIFHRGDPGDTLHMIRSGRVKIVLASPSGEEVLLALMGPGDFFGELSLLDGRPRSATAITGGPTVTLTLAREEFIPVLLRTAALAHQVMLALGTRIRRTNLLLGDSAFLEVRSRVERRLLDLAKTTERIEQRAGSTGIRITQTELAAMVGASRESVNRILRSLEAKGLIALERGRIRLEGLNRAGQADW